MDKDEKIGLLITVSIVILISAICISASYFRMKSFNEATGNEITLWQAMTSKLVIVDSPSEK